MLREPVEESDIPTHTLSTTASFCDTQNVFIFSNLLTQDPKNIVLFFIF